jgi:adenosylmethionine---8-amino-7-oxononanoate aminotransferase
MPDQPPNTDTLRQLDQKYLWHPFTQMQRWQREKPVIIAEGEGNYLIDSDGKRYLDAVSSLWVNVHGHRCPTLDDALIKQSRQLAHSTLLGLTNIPAIEFAEALINVAPASLQRVFYSDSGSTAVEVALKIAYQYWQHTGRPNKSKFVALDAAYHGDTIGSVSVGGIDLFHQIFHPLLFSVERVPTPHAYRCAVQDLPHSPKECSAHCLAALEALFQEKGDQLAALVIESRMQGAAGMLLHPPGYLASVAKLCRQYEILLICDEVATGFGRTGEYFSCMAENVEPDLMAVAKGITGGYLPLAATLCSEEIYNAFLGGADKTFFHGHTYTGNPLACAVALASLRLIDESDLLNTVRKRSTTLQEQLTQHIAPIANVGQIRQLGLMVGIELVADRASRKPFPPAERLGAEICQRAREHGLLLRPLGDVIVLMPPLTISPTEIDFLIQGLQTSIEEVLARRTELP